MAKKPVKNGLEYVRKEDSSLLRVSIKEALVIGTQTIWKLKDHAPWMAAYYPTVKEHKDHFEIEYKIKYTLEEEEK